MCHPLPALLDRLVRQPSLQGAKSGEDSGSEECPAGGFWHSGWGASLTRGTINGCSIQSTDASDVSVQVNCHLERRDAGQEVGLSDVDSLHSIFGVVGSALNAPVFNGTNDVVGGTGMEDSPMKKKRL